MSDDASQHNQRIAAKRERALTEFVQTTSSNVATAKHYCRLAAFDLERAVGLFYDGGAEAMPSDDDDEREEEAERDEASAGGAAAASASASSSPDDEENVAADPADADPISSILKSAKKETPPPSSSSSSFGGGPGRTLNGSGNDDRAGGGGDDDALATTLRVRVAFYRDGFTAAAEETEEASEEKAGSSASSSARRRGVHSIASTSGAAADGRRRLAPLRDYETPENRRFIDDVKESRVPVEFRKVDSRGRPNPVSILLEDRRPGKYPAEEWRQQQLREEQQQQQRGFQGAGQTLGGSGARAATAGGPVDSNGSVAQSNSGVLTWLLGWVWGLLHRLWVKARLYLRIASATVSPPKKHTVDRSKERTTIAIRFPPGGEDMPTRIRVEFNTDHTVGDLRNYCDMELASRSSTAGSFSHRAFEMVSGFPPRPIECFGQADSTTAALSLQDAGLLNAAVEIRILPTAEEKRQN